MDGANESFAIADHERALADQNDQVGLAGVVPAKARLVSGNGTAGQLSAGASAPRNRGRQRLIHKVNYDTRMGQAACPAQLMNPDRPHGAPPEDKRQWQNAE